MRLSYDPAKSERNKADRGLAFGLAEEFDWSSAMIVEDRRKDYEERRYQALGSIGEQSVHAGVHAARRHFARDQSAQGEPTRKDALCQASQTPS